MQPAPLPPRWSSFRRGQVPSLLLPGTAIPPGNPVKPGRWAAAAHCANRRPSCVAPGDGAGRPCSHCHAGGMSCCRPARASMAASSWMRSGKSRCSGNLQAWKPKGQIVWVGWWAQETPAQIRRCCCGQIPVKFPATANLTLMLRILPLWMYRDW